jgi:hypothetical protein
MSQVTQPASVAAPPSAPPYSALVRRALGICLIVAAVTNGLSQYVGHLVVGDRDWVEQVRWGSENLAFQRAEQGLLVVSTLVMPLGLLGIAQVTRWASPRLTLVATPLLLWGMWGFHNILAIGYITGTAAPQLIGLETALELNEEMVTDPGAGLLGLLPHLLGTLLGLVLLMAAAWRSGCFPKAACGLVLAFLAWDYFLPPVGPVEAHLLLFVGWTWLGVALLRMPDRVWRGGAS